LKAFSFLGKRYDGCGRVVVLLVGGLLKLDNELGVVLGKKLLELVFILTELSLKLLLSQGESLVVGVKNLELGKSNLRAIGGFGLGDLGGVRGNLLKGDNPGTEDVDGGGSELGISQRVKERRDKESAGQSDRGKLGSGPGSRLRLSKLHNYTRLDRSQCTQFL
jgi:hypothetical protein